MNPSFVQQYRDLGGVGGGLAAGVFRRKTGRTVVVWLLTLVTAVGAGFVLYRGLSTALAVA